MPPRRLASTAHARRPSTEGSPLPRTWQPSSSLHADGSLSVVRQDDEASNSGLLDLVPTLGSVSSAAMHTPVLGDRARMPPPVLGKQRPRKISRSGVPWTRARARDSLSDASTEASNASVIVHEAPDEAPASDVPVDEAAPSTLPARLRRWMHDAMKQHMYETAIFWGQQVVALEPTELAYNDAYWLAQAYFYTHQYARAEHLLTTPLRCGAVPLDASAPGATPVGTQGDALQAALDATRADSALPPAIQARRARAGTYTSVTDAAGDALDAAPVPGRRVSRRRKRSPSLTDPFHVPGPACLPLDAEFARVVVPSDTEAHGPCLVNWSSPCRYLAAQCLVRLGRFHEALELTGEDHTRWTGRASAKTPALDGGLKLSSSVCHLRGQIHLRLDEPWKAKEAFMLALALDVKNYDSFSALLDGCLLGEDELWEFVQTLEFAAQAGSDAEARADLAYVRLMYTARLPKRAHAHAAQAAAARQRLVEEHTALRTNAEVLLSLAEALYQAMRYEDAHGVSSHLLALDPGAMLALPVHIASMYYLPRLHPALFLLAHRLTEAHPDSCEAWYAVGTWYASAQRWSEARRYFSKASLLDPRFVPSWIAFGHSFALEGESDQAITAYSTAARKFPNSGLPRLFLGMEHLAQGNRSLAQLFLQSAEAELGDDPLCANERGVALFQSGCFAEAIDCFRAALDAAADTQQPAAAWSPVHLNLGLAYRRMQRDDEARACFLRVLDYDPACASAYIALGLCAHRRGDLADAIGWYHEGLGIDPRDPIGTELLDLALDARVAQGLPPALHP
ncbi:anaphase-promoting complex subunit Cut9 [Malassezia caprae]|uniref:Anaphase-promoting complex subunit Cut9 n=1 Tax=Malassezia caprae TaxID=1381934 RepID=A0AAF0E938_9BASI|nr:anaphase-promoting complex subunit Cut9 [Malassezia caprae]